MRRAPFVIAATAAGLFGLVSYRPDVSEHVDTKGLAAGSDRSSGSSGVLGRRAFIGSKPYIDYGHIRVRAVIEGGTVRSVKIDQLDLENVASKHIAERAIPILLRETIAAGDAQVDSVSGATFTSKAYRSSLQAAIDDAAK